VVAFPQLLKLSAVPIALVLASGLLFTLGAIVYGRKRPDPRPQFFGYHEVFHLLTVLAVACEYVVVAFYVLPRA
jgi:hemolysin III